MSKFALRCGALVAVGLATACGTGDQTGMSESTMGGQASAPPAGALNAITSEGLLDHIRVLASDSFEGRAPATVGEERTVAYLTDQFKELGLQPGNPDGTYTQAVPLVGITSKTSAAFNVHGRAIDLEPLVDYVAISRRVQPEVDVKNSPIVFVGYGVVAPEYGWDDYKDVDVRGKTIVMLVNDPAIPDPNDPSRLDDNMFRGRAMTYYGRWTYKYEIATEKGAAAAVIIHETGPAGYPFAVVTGSWGRENFDIATPDGNRRRVAVEAWITTDKARELFRDAGLDFDDMKQAALHKDFRPVDLGGSADFQVQQTTRQVQSRNVVAKLEGSDPAQKDEYVIYTAHWDHLGRDSALQGDQIFNGALDNASGVSSLLELARAFKALPQPPHASILFLSVTAEEKGLLGSEYYATHPLYPLKQTLADINMDGVNQWGPTKDIVVIGYGRSNLDDLVEQIAAGQQRVVKPDPEPEKGYYYRSDHFEFAKQGVPALYVDAGTDYIGKPAGWGQQKRDEYTAHDYHKVSDEIKPDWDLTGAVQDLQSLFQVGYDIAQGDLVPQWKEGTEFKAKRDSMMSAATH